MNLRSRPLGACLLALGAAVLPSADARACGGCFAPQSEMQSTVVTGHRMAVSVSTTQTVLWDQIKYAGSPSDFAWVLPIRAGAVIQLSTDAWFETLDAATTAQIVSPPINCGSSGGSGCGIGCGSASSADFAVPGSANGGGPTVTVTHEGTVGPYETVTLHANVPDALPSWLQSHGYAISSSVSPIIDAYTSAGFDFIALRLLPAQGVQQMKPVRVVSPGMSPTLPLRMVAAGTGADVAITLFVIGEGRWEAANFANGMVDPTQLTWNFTTQSSNYAVARQALLESHGGLLWNTAFANQGSLLSQDQTANGPTTITVGSMSFPTLAAAYVAQGVSNNETQNTSCLTGFMEFSDASQQVDGSCLNQASSETPDGGAGGGGAGGGDAGTGGGGTGGGTTGLPCNVPSNEIDASQLACGPLDDIAVALVGLHPRDVWLTRLEANLPHSALGNDLQLQASASQTPVSNVFTLTQSTGDPCAVSAAGLLPGGAATRTSGPRTQLAMFAAILAAAAATWGRRRRRGGLVGAAVLAAHRQPRA